MIKAKVTLEPISHIYTDSEGNEYKSVSRLIGSVKKPFEKDMIAKKVAEKRERLAQEEASRRGISIMNVVSGWPENERATTKEGVLKEWGHTNKVAIDKGNLSHDALEATMKFGTYPEPLVQDLCMKMEQYFMGYNKAFPEQIVYSDKYGVAGMVDLPLRRTRSSKSIIDIFDYKTNEIKFDSTRIDSEGKVVNANQFLLEPLSHLEECNYNTYCIQLSIYAFLLEEHGYKIGKLAIVNITDHLKGEFHIIPVPYMRAEAIALLEHGMKDVIQVSKPQEVKEERTVISGEPAF